MHYFHRTFSEINKPEELEQKCLELCKCLADDLAQKNLKVSSYSNCKRCSHPASMVLNFMPVHVWKIQ